MSIAEVVTLGCRLNHAESEGIAATLAGRDVVVINGCAVTESAMRDTAKAARRARRERPSAEILVTGCAAQIDPARFAAMPEVSRVLGNQEKRDPLALLGSQDARIRVSDFDRVRETAPHMAVAFSGRTRAFVEVQNGCDHSCTFCIIAPARGPSRSVPAGAIVDRIAELVDAGAREIVLTGVDLTSYGHDLPGSPSLGLLVERIVRAVPTLPRLRLSSLDGIEIDDRLFELLTGEPRLMPHVHLSLQAGDDMILKRMKRRHSNAQALALIARLKAARPEIAIGADIIAGFPTEDEAMFANSLGLIEQAEIVHAHIFPFSPRAGTPAARMPQVPVAAVRERAARLRAAASAVQTRWLQSLIGSTQSVLVEADGVTGHAANFATVKLDTACAPGSIAAVRIAAAQPRHLQGRIIA